MTQQVADDLRAAKALNRSQIRFLCQLSEGGYRVGSRPEDYGLSPLGYQRLVASGFIEEAWTWASTTRPDVRRTPAGTRAIAAESAT